MQASTSFASESRARPAIFATPKGAFGSKQLNGRAKRYLVIDLRQYEFKHLQTPGY
jgi:hypothetical protein